MFDMWLFGIMHGIKASSTEGERVTGVATQARLLISAVLATGRV